MVFYVQMYVYTVLAVLVRAAVACRFFFSLLDGEVDAAVGGDQPDVADIRDLKESFQQPVMMCPIRRIRDSLQFAS